MGYNRTFLIILIFSCKYYPNIHDYRFWSGYEYYKETIEDIEDLTGASAAIRRRCKEMNPKKCFDGQEKEALEGMRLVIGLSDLAKNLTGRRCLSC